MKMRSAVLAALISTLGLAPIWAASKPQATVKASKGPVQITLRLHKTTVKMGKSLWYKLELKNVGKKKMIIQDRIFKDPWAMHENCRIHRGIYLEIIYPDGKPVELTWGAGLQTYDYEAKEYTKEEKDEIEALIAKWKKSGMTEQQQHIALLDWSSDWNFKKRQDEVTDPDRQSCLKPGASTTTFAWAYRDTSEYASHEREQAQVGDYTQLFSYEFYRPGTYRVRAVYNNSLSKANRKELTEKYHLKIDAWLVKVKTPFIEIEVLP